jgi:hypothetical protein
MFLSVATLCTLLATAEARDYLMDGILKYLESRTPKQQQQAMTTTQRPVLKNANSKMQNDTRIEEEDTYKPTDIQTNANTAFEICILLSPIILIALVLKKNLIDTFHYLKLERCSLTPRSSSAISFGFTEGSKFKFF